MSVALAVALLALLVALFTLVALVAVYARLRGLEAAGDVAVSGYPALVGRPAPVSVRPGPDDAAGLVAIVDGDCALCGALLDALADVDAAGGVHVVALSDRRRPRRRTGLPARGRRGPRRPVRGLRAHGPGGRRRGHGRRPPVRLRRHRSAGGAARAASPGPGPPKARRAGYDRHRRDPHHVDPAGAAQAQRRRRPAARLPPQPAHRPAGPGPRCGRVHARPARLVPVAARGRCGAVGPLRVRHLQARPVRPGGPTTGGRAARRSATADGGAAPTRARTATTAKAPSAPAAWSTTRRG